MIKICHDCGREIVWYCLHCNPAFTLEDRIVESSGKLLSSKPVMNTGKLGKATQLVLTKAEAFDRIKKLVEKHDCSCTCLCDDCEYDIDCHPCLSCELINEIDKVA